MVSMKDLSDKIPPPQKNMVRLILIGGGSSGNTGSFQPAFGGGFGFQSDSGMGGFKPAGSPNPNWGFQAASGSPGSVAEGEDYLDDEERERVQRVLQEVEERKEKLYTKQ